MVLARWRSRVHEILQGQRREDPVARWLNAGIVALILLNVAAFVLESVAELSARYGPAFHAFEIASVAVFSVEYLLRLWSATEDPERADPIAGRLRWAATPLALVDLFAVLPFYLGALVPLDLRVLRVLRLLRLVRVLKLARYSRALQAMGRVIRRKRRERLMTLFACSLLLILASSMMWMAEHEVQPDAFPDIPAALWWAVVTLTTVGYGDVVPITLVGRIIAAAIALIGVGFIALPAGILASGSVEELSEEQQAAEQAGQALPARCPHCGELLAGEDIRTGGPGETGGG